MLRRFRWKERFLVPGEKRLEMLCYFGNARGRRGCFACCCSWPEGLRLLPLMGCGISGNGFFDQAQQSYTVTVTAKSENLQHSTTLTVVVE
jgi:hypothetical protein